jgi:hypothetical protein
VTYNGLLKHPICAGQNLVILNFCQFWLKIKESSNQNQTRIKPESNQSNQNQTKSNQKSNHSTNQTSNWTKIIWCTLLKMVQITPASPIAGPSWSSFDASESI